MRIHPTRFCGLFRFSFPLTSIIMRGKEVRVLAMQVTVQQVVQRFQMEVVTGEQNLRRGITISDIHRPGLELAGYFEYYPADRVQLLGRTELSFAASLPSETLLERFRFLCQKETPCICITRGLAVPPELLKVATETGTPVLRTNLSTIQFTNKLTYYLEEMLAPRMTIHGVLMDVYGIGVLLLGSSGIGKSETALELVKRGHRLVADDAVEIRQVHDRLIGQPPDLIKHLLEIRGVGIINVMTLFGAGAVRPYKKVSLAVRLEMWEEGKHYDRLGIDEETLRLLDIEIPIVTIPVRPGRNLAVIVEVAAMNYRLKVMGHNEAVLFAERLNKVLGE